MEEVNDGPLVFFVLLPGRLTSIRETSVNVDLFPWVMYRIVRGLTGNLIPCLKNKVDSTIMTIKIIIMEIRRFLFDFILRHFSFNCSLKTVQS